METKNIGLRGIEVADTRISNIDGEYYIDLNEDGSCVLPSNF